MDRLMMKRKSIDNDEEDEFKNYHHLINRQTETETNLQYQALMTN